MATYTDQEQLDAVRAAINAILTGQFASLTIHARTVVKLGLDELRKMEMYYQRRVAAGSSTTRPGVGAFRNPSSGGSRIASSDT